MCKHERMTTFHGQFVYESNDDRAFTITTRIDRQSIQQFSRSNRYLMTVQQIVVFGNEHKDEYKDMWLNVELGLHQPFSNAVAAGEVSLASHARSFGVGLVPYGFQMKHTRSFLVENIFEQDLTLSFRIAGLDPENNAKLFLETDEHNVSFLANFVPIGED
jgi:hypothetical protein